MLARIDEDGAHAGSLEVIFGPMFSGKSTELQRRLRRHTVASRRVLVVKHAGIIGTTSRSAPRRRR